MSRDKQIEEMAKIMCNCYDSGNCKMHGKLCDLKCISGFNALGLYNAGYRKSTDLAEEIFAEIETSLVIGGFVNGEKYIAIREDDYNHYKKKYTEKESK